MLVTLSIFRGILVPISEPSEQFVGTALLTLLSNYCLKRYRLVFIYPQQNLSSIFIHLRNQVLLRFWGFFLLYSLPFKVHKLSNSSGFFLNRFDGISFFRSSLIFFIISFPFKGAKIPFSSFSFLWCLFRS